MKFLIVILFLLSACSGPDTETSGPDTETNETPNTPDPAETLYTISFFYAGVAPDSIKLTTQGKTLNLGSTSFPTCVALNQSELATFAIEVYVSNSLLEECSCNNNQGSTRKPCTTKFNHHVLGLLGEDLGSGINWQCAFGVQTKDLPVPSTCKRFQ